jgi:hypothetical protein
MESQLTEVPILKMQKRQFVSMMMVIQMKLMKVIRNAKNKTIQ